MVRIIILNCLLLLSLVKIEAQQALDFKLTDIEGKQWHLFEELDKGKTVLLDFFYADCVPCQTLTPQIAKIYSDYGSDTGQILVLGISDRDNDIRLKTFESNYGVNYPSGGIEGNGDSITLAYSSWFSFIGWPTYAVICPNRDMSWDVDKSQNGLPEIRSAIDTCVFYTSVKERVDSKPFVFKIKNDQLEIYSYSNESYSLQVSDINGRQLSGIEIKNSPNPYRYSVNNLPKGIYIVRIQSGTTVQTFKFIKRQ